MMGQLRIVHIIPIIKSSTYASMGQPLLVETAEMENAQSKATQVWHSIKNLNAAGDGRDFTTKPVLEKRLKNYRHALEKELRNLRVLIDENNARRH